MSVNDNEARHGNFTSSEIVALIKSGKAAKTYVNECNYERRLLRSITTESNAKPLLWGNLIEAYANQKLDLSYNLSSQESIFHPDFDFWAGSPDGVRHIKEGAVFDIKAPWTPKSFCQLVQPLYDCDLGFNDHTAAIEEIRKNHPSGETYYWQLISNACITGSDWAELIVYMPYQSELINIRAMIEGDPNYYGLYYAQPDEMPYLLDGGYYKDLNIIRFPVPKEDKILLTDRVAEYGKQLIHKHIKEGS